jgi:hypothetical protein
MIIGTTDNCSLFIVMNTDKIKGELESSILDEDWLERAEWREGN